MVSNFFVTYFGWEPSIASVIWAILIAVAVRFFVWVRRTGWLDHEVVYWIGTPIACLILLAALSYAARGGKSLKPDFRVQIAQMTAGTPSDNKSSTSMILGLYLFNNGQPSVALGYQLSVSVPGAFSDKIGQTMTLPESLPFSDPKTGQVQTFLGTDALYTKTLHPIITGGVESGILWFIRRC
jgi:hypothetical protein